MQRVETTDRRPVVVLAVVFGAASIPWTYGFLAGAIPLWPAFIGSAGYYASDRGVMGWIRTVLAAVLGIGYAAITLATVGDAGLLVLSVVVGLGMFLASLHPLVSVLSHAPAAFLGYAVMFSVDAAQATLPGIPGIVGLTVAAVVSFVVGAGIGLGTDYTAGTLATTVDS